MAFQSVVRCLREREAACRAIKKTFPLQRKGLCLIQVYNADKLVRKQISANCAPQKKPVFPSASPCSRPLVRNQCQTFCLWHRIRWPSWNPLQEDQGRHPMQASPGWLLEEKGLKRGAGRKAKGGEGKNLFYSPPDFVMFPFFVRPEFLSCCANVHCENHCWRGRCVQIRHPGACNVRPVVSCCRRRCASSSPAGTGLPRMTAPMPGCGHADQGQGVAAG